MHGVCCTRKRFTCAHSSLSCTQPFAPQASCAPHVHGTRCTRKRCIYAHPSPALYPALRPAGQLCPPDLKDWKVQSVRVNGSGTLVAALLVGPEPARAVRLVVWCGEAAVHHTHDFTADGRAPVGLMWDTVEPKLLVVQTTVRGTACTGGGGRGGEGEAVE